MRSRAPRICVISATPLTMFFFFSEHLRLMSKWADVTVVYNKKYNPEVQPIKAPVFQEHVNIRRGISLWNDLCTLFSLARLFRRNEFDLVITLVPKAGFLGMLAARFCQVPVRLNIFQGEVWAVKEGASRFLLRSTSFLTSFCSTDLLAVSESQRKFLIKEGVAPANKISVLGSGSIGGVDSSRFKSNPLGRSKLRERYNIDEHAYLLLFVGRITHDKGVVSLVNAFASLLIHQPNTFLILVGPDEEALSDQLKKKLSAENQHKLIFPGFTREPESYMSAADILCLPSRREGFGMVALEAAACELPSIGTNIYGIQDAIVHDKTGLLVPVDDENALLKGIKVLINDQKLRDRLGKSGRLRVLSNFESCSVIENYISFFKERLGICKNSGK